MWHGYGGAGWGAGIFWLFIAAAVVAGAWEKVRRNAEKHETLRRIIEKTGTVDEAKLRELFNSPTSDWGASAPGAGYRALRIAGTIVLWLTAGLVVFFFAMGQGGVISQTVMIIGLSASTIVGMVGFGLWFSSRFAEPPPGRGNEPPTR